MKLFRLGFNYNIKDQKFSFISYEFVVSPEKFPEKKLVEIAKASLGDLEYILDTQYSGKKFSKEENGDISSVRIGYGYDYATRLFDKESSNSKLRCEITTIHNYPNSLQLSLTNHDSNSQRLLKVYDGVMNLPDLECNEEVQSQIKTITLLREQPFDISRMHKYLDASRK